MIEFISDPMAALWLLGFAGAGLLERWFSTRRPLIVPWFLAALLAVGGLSHPLEDLHGQPASTYVLTATSLRVAVFIPLCLVLAALLFDRVVVNAWRRRASQRAQPR